MKTALALLIALTLAGTLAVVGAADDPVQQTVTVESTYQGRCR